MVGLDNPKCLMIFYDSMIFCIWFLIGLFQSSFSFQFQNNLHVEFKALHFTSLKEYNLPIARSFPYATSEEFKLLIYFRCLAQVKGDLSLLSSRIHLLANWPGWDGQQSSMCSSWLCSK